MELTRNRTVSNHLFAGFWDWGAYMREQQGSIYRAWYSGRQGLNRLFEQGLLDETYYE